MQNLSYLFIYLPQWDKSLWEKREKVFSTYLQNLHDASLESPVSFEILWKWNYAYFYLTVHTKIKKTIESITYANFTNCEIIEMNHDHFGSSYWMECRWLKTIRSDLFPIKTFEHFDGCSMSNLISVIEKSTWDIWYQIVLQKQDSWAWYHLKRSLRKKLFSFFDYLNPRNWIHTQMIKLRKTRHEEATSKLSDDVFITSIRFWAQDKWDLNAIQTAFTPYWRTDINEFTVAKKIKISDIQKRKIITRNYLSNKEIATIFHFPNPDFTSHIVHLQSKRAEPPRDVPKTRSDNVSFFGKTNYHWSSIPFWISQDDRQRHLYMVWKSGSWKSKCLELLIKEDVETWRWFCLLDPHGDLVDNVLRFIPKERIKDVIVFDPSNTDFPVAFNPIENVDPALKMQVTIWFISIFKKLFWDNWSPKLEHVLRYTLLALLSSKNTTTLSIQKMLTDKNYRQKIVSRIEDSTVKSFWVSEFAWWSEKFDAEAITPLLNKVWQFVATDIIRNIVGQPKSAFNIRDIMDNEKILLVKVSKWLLWDENAGLIWSMFVTKIHEAAMSRADTKEEDRKNFTLYVDEFQNFATDTFAEILSEARKYRLNLTIAHQYMWQLSSTIQKTVFWNVGSIVSFRVWAEDAGILANEYTPVFSDRDIINLWVREFYAKLSVSWEIREAFSGMTLNVNYNPTDLSWEIIKHSNEKYWTNKDEVNELLWKWDESWEFENSAPKMDEAFIEPLI